MPGAVDREALRADRERAADGAGLLVVAQRDAVGEPDPNANGGVQAVNESSPATSISWWASGCSPRSSARANSRAGPSMLIVQRSNGAAHA